jgi:hypothetical protein
MPTVYATFENADIAGKAVDDLIAAGFSPDKISLLVSNSTRERYFPSQNDAGLDKGGTTGAATGGAVGAGLGALAGGLLLGGALTVITGGLAAPLLAAGPLAGALTGAIGGGAVGTITGGLVGTGLSEHVAQNIDDGIRQGALVVAVDATDDRAAAAETILKQGEGTIRNVSDAPIPPVEHTT